jgi:hypothetical protein
MCISRKRFALTAAVVVAGAIVWSASRITEYHRQLSQLEGLPAFWIRHRPLVPQSLADRLPEHWGERELPVIEGIGLYEAKREEIAKLREFSDLKYLEIYETPVTAQDITNLLRECPLEVVSIDRLAATASEIATLRSKHPGVRLEIHEPP